MKSHRVIARLDIKGPNLVKGIHLEGLRVLGQPSEFANHYYRSGADEIMYTDVVASLYDRNSLHDIISETAQHIAIPMLVGGGLRSLDDISKVLRAGADRVSLNTAAIKDPQIVSRAAKKFGSSTIVVTIEAIKQPDGQYLVYTDSGREHTGIEAVGWAQKVAELGVGEIIITSVDQEGTRKGFDVELTRMVSDAVSVPVVAHGGCSGAKDVSRVLREGHADAVAVASVIHYDYMANHQIKIEPVEKVNYINSGRAFSKSHTESIEAIKAQLLEDNIGCRPAFGGHYEP